MELTIAQKIDRIPKYTEYCRNCRGYNKLKHGYFCSISCANVYFYSNWVSRLLTTIENATPEDRYYIMEGKK